MRRSASSAISRSAGVSTVRRSSVSTVFFPPTRSAIEARETAGPIPQSSRAGAAGGDASPRGGLDHLRRIIDGLWEGDSVAVVDAVTVGEKT
jgi:hypothetical protein